MNFFNKMSLRWRLGIGFALPMLIIVVLSGTVYSGVSSLTKSADLVNETHAAIEFGTGIMVSMVNMETGLRGFLVSGKEEFLQPYVAGSDEFEGTMAKAVVHVQDNPQQVSRLKKIQLLKEQWVSEHAEPAIALRREVLTGDEAAASFKELSGRTIGTQKFMALRAALAELTSLFEASNDLRAVGLVQSMLQDMVNQESSQRYFLLNGRDDSLQPFWSAGVDFQKHVQAVRDVVETSLNNELSQSIERAYDPNLVLAKLVEAESLAQAWVSEAAQPEIDARFIMNTVTATLDDITAFIEQGIGLAFTNDIRSILDEYSAEEKILIDMRTADAANTASLTTTVTVGAAIASLILGLLVTFFITRNILGQIGGEPQEVDRIARAIAEGDLSMELVTDGKSQQGVYASMIAMKTRLTDVVREIKTAADSVKTGSTEISQGNATLSQRTEEQASSLEETASSMEQMTATVKQNADSAGEANQLAKAAREQAENGGEVVSKAVSAMSEISASSKKIADIIGVIDEIAFQTNLLALNASVEAARAGEQGRGFAVVASEVRNLAGRSATAAKEIKELIEDSVTKVEEGGRLVGESGDTLNEIVNSVKKVSDIIGEIAAASREQTTGIEEVNRAIVQMDELTQQNAALVEQAAAASESMGEQAIKLNESMMFFTVDQSEHSTERRETASPAVLSGANPAGPPGGIERRGKDRPWAASDNSALAEGEAAQAPSRRKVANAGDAEWEEF